MPPRPAILRRGAVPAYALDTSETSNPDAPPKKTWQNAPPPLNPPRRSTHDQRHEYEKRGDGRHRNEQLDRGENRSHGRDKYNNHEGRQQEQAAHAKEEKKIEEPVIHDPRMARLAKINPAATSRRRQRFQAEEVKEKPKEEDEPSNVPPTSRQEERVEIGSRKRRHLEIEENIIPKVEEEVKPIAQEEEEEEEDESSEEEEPLPPPPPRIRPVFVKKDKRSTVQLTEVLSQDQLLQESRKEIAAMERKKELDKFVAEEIQKDKLAEIGIDDNYRGTVDDTDDLDPEEEFNSWKLRELLRIKRDREEQLRQEEEEADIERRRNMTDAEIAREDKHKFIREAKPVEKQMYHHKGAFYKEEREELEKVKAVRPRAVPEGDETLFIPERVADKELIGHSAE